MIFNYIKYKIVKKKKNELKVLNDKQTNLINLKSYIYIFFLFLFIYSIYKFIYDIL